MSFGTFLFQLLIQPILYLIETSFLLFNEVFGNIGIAVVGVSFVVSIFCLPLYIIAEKWQSLDLSIQKKLEPGIKRIKQTFKGDEQYMIHSSQKLKMPLLKKFVNILLIYKAENGLKFVLNSWSIVKNERKNN